MAVTPLPMGRTNHELSLVGDFLVVTGGAVDGPGDTDHEAAPLLADLDPSSSGSVHADVRNDRLVVTWNGVPQFGLTDSNTFQAVLHSYGEIDLVYVAPERLVTNEFLGVLA